MACGCGKNKMARPSGSSVAATPTVSIQTRQTATAKVVATASPYTTQQNKAPAHLMTRRTV